MVKTILAAVAMVAAAWAGPVHAEAEARNESGTVALVSAVTAVGTADTLEAGLAFHLEPGWKIYWRTPGDAGYPPKVDWSGSDNAGTPVVSWPAPKRFVLSGLQNYGYGGEVILPLRVPVTRPGQAVRLAAAVDYLACAVLCVPMQANLDLEIPAGPAEPSAAAHDIGRFRALVPGPGHGLTLVSAEAVGQGENAALRLTVTADAPLDHPDAFVESEDGAAFEAPRLTLSEQGRRAEMTLSLVPHTLGRSLAGAPLTVTVADGNRSLEQAVTATPAAAPAAGMLPAMLGVALLGGLVLNLMPCVLPVLSIKILGAIGHGGAERGHVRAAFLASAAGILASFLGLAGAAVAFKALGRTVGWGIQFQQPGFLAAMAALLALFAANLWGVFEIPLPGWLQRSGQGRVPHHTLAGHFLSGAFATLLATPCSAPFLGTAVGFALARGPAEIWAIFAALGTGMAVPYLAVAVRPEVAVRLPKPGRWMLRLRGGLGLALAVTALWLLSVLAVQAGLANAVTAGGALAGAVLVLAAGRRLPHRGTAARVAAAALVALALGASFQAGPGESGDAGTEAGIAWVPFDPAAIGAAVVAGKVVFVDATAEWCITCKVNKATVIERGEVARRLSSGGVVAMKADWTRPDERISRFLASFGRYGVPFNVVYGPGAPEGIPLSEILTESEVLAALDRAASNR